MRLLHVFAGPYPTIQGTQVLVGQLCRLLATRGHDVHLLSYAHAGWTSHEPFHIHRIPDVPRFREERSGPAPRKAILDLSLAATLKRLTRQVDPHLVHAHHYEALAAARIADPRRRRPLLFHAHALFEPELPTYFPGHLGRPAALLGRLTDSFLPRLADGVAAVSDVVGERLRRNGVAGDLIRVVPPPREPVPRPGEKNARATTPEGVVRAVYCGNLDAYQELDLLLDGLELLPGEARARLDVEVVTGSDPRRFLETVCSRRLDDVVEVVPHGTGESALARIAAADMALLPRSTAGGAPIKLVNYLSAGLPTIIDIRLAGGLLHGSDVFAVDMKEPDAVARALLTLSGDPDLRERLSRGAHEAAERLFGEDSVLTALLEACDAAIEYNSTFRLPRQK